MKQKPRLQLQLLLSTGLLLIALPASADLIHRYGFNESPGSTTVIDSVGGGTYNGMARVATTQGGAGAVTPTFDGSQVTLDGVGGYIDLPNGLVSSLNSVCFEVWFTWNDDADTWTRILDFGVNDLGEDIYGTNAAGTGQNYLFVTPRAGGSLAPRFAITPGANTAELPVLDSSLGGLSTNQEHYIVVNYGPDGAEMYIDGQLAATGPYDTPLSAVQDVNDFLGRSQWGDPFFSGKLNEFRIHDSPLSQEDILIHQTRGPDDTLLFPPEITSLTPTNGTIFASTASPVSFSATSTAAIPASGVIVKVNGVTVSPTLTGAGTPSVSGTYSGLQQNQFYDVSITVTNSTGSKTVRTKFDTFVEAQTLAIEAENFNFDGGNYIQSPVLGFDAMASDNYWLKGALDGLTNVDYVELNGGTRPTVGGSLGSEWRYDTAGYRTGGDQSLAEVLPQTTDNTDVQRDVYVSATVPDYDLVSLQNGEWVNYTHDFGASQNYRVYLRGRATAAQTVRLDRVTGDRTMPNQTAVIIGSYAFSAGNYSYAELTGLDGNPVVLNMSGVQTLRLTAVNVNGNLRLNNFRFVPTTDAATVLRPYVSALYPANNGVNARRDLITATITDRDTTVDSGTIQLFVDGNPVTPTVTTNVTGADLSYTVSPKFAPNSMHTAELRFSDDQGDASTNTWSFTTTTDVDGPLLTYAAGNIAGAQSKLRIFFSEPLDPATAGEKTNYTSSGGVTFSAASVLTGDQVVELTASGVVEGSNYTVTVNNVGDAVANPIAANSTIEYNLSPFNQTVDGLAVFEAESYFTSSPATVPPSANPWEYVPVFDPNYTGGGAMRTTAPYGANIGNDPIAGGAARMDYRVVFRQTGTYTLWARSSSPTAGTMDSMSLGLDGTYVFSLNGPAPGAPTWRNGVQNGANSIIVNSTGEHIINLWMRESGNIVDKLLLAPSGMGSPVTSGSTDVGPSQSPRTGQKIPPVVELTAPLDQSAVASGSDVMMTATVTDADSATALVEFFVDGAKVGEDTDAPYSYTVTGLSDRFHVFSARATDPDNLTGYSLSAKVKVGDALRALFIVDNTTTLTAGDASVQERLQGLGIDVVIENDAASLATDVPDKNVVVISSSVQSTDVGNKFLGATVPVVSWESFLQDDMLYTGTIQDTDFGTPGSQTTINIVNEGHPMAAGFANGPVTVHTSGQPANFGIPVAGATIIASIDDNDVDRAVLYGLETGTLLYDGATTTASRQVHLWLTDAAISVATDEGLKLFDAAMSWAVNRTLTYVPPGGGSVPTIGTPQIDIGTGMITISGTGGTSGAGYRILSSTDIAMPLASWTEVGSGTFDGSGNFSTAVSLPNDPNRYYAVVSP